MAHGLYEVYINGVKLGDEYLTPGYHSYDLLQQYQTYDVTDFLIEDTEVSFIVGNGWYRGRFIFEGGFENIYGNKQQLIASCKWNIQMELGSDLGSDETWLVE